MYFANQTDLQTGMGDVDWGDLLGIGVQAGAVIGKTYLEGEQLKDYQKSQLRMQQAAAENERQMMQMQMDMQQRQAEMMALMVERGRVGLPPGPDRGPMGVRLPKGAGLAAVGAVGLLVILLVVRR